MHSAEGANAMLSDVALNEENARLSTPTNFGNVAVLLYICLHYSKGGDCSNMLFTIAIGLTTESDIYTGICR